MILGILLQSILLIHFGLSDEWQDQALPEPSGGCCGACIGWGDILYESLCDDPKDPAPHIIKCACRGDPKESPPEEIRTYDERHAAWKIRCDERIKKKAYTSTVPMTFGGGDSSGRSEHNTPLPAAHDNEAFFRDRVRKLRV